MDQNRIAGIDARLAAADRSWDAGTIAQVAVNILLDNPGMSFLDIEDRLRAIGSKTTWLVAMPKSFAPAGVRCGWYGGSITDRDFFLWVCVNGMNDMLNELHRTGMTIAQNREALKTTGVLIQH